MKPKNVLLIDDSIRTTRETFKKRKLQYEEYWNCLLFWIIFIDRYLHGYLSLHIEGNVDLPEVFRLFYMFLKDKAFK